MATTMPPKYDERTAVCLDVARSLHHYARRWVVDVSDRPIDALIYDATMQFVATHQPDLARAPEDGVLGSAAAERALRHGEEPVREPFTLPATLADAAVLLHRYARRYTNGRGTHPAATVNDMALQLLAVGVRLDATKEQDGTIWAADGAGGTHDGLTPAQRREALSTLPPHPR